MKKTVKEIKEIAIEKLSILKAEHEDKLSIMLDDHSKIVKKHEEKVSELMVENLKEIDNIKLMELVGLSVYDTGENSVKIKEYIKAAIIDKFEERSKGVFSKYDGPMDDCETDHYATEPIKTNFTSSFFLENRMDCNMSNAVFMTCDYIINEMKDVNEVHFDLADIGFFEKNGWSCFEFNLNYITI